MFDDALGRQTDRTAAGLWTVREAITGQTCTEGMPDNQPGQMDYGWLGQHHRPHEHAGALPPECTRSVAATRHLRTRASATAHPGFHARVRHRKRQDLRKPLAILAWFTIEDLGVLVRRHRPDDSITRALARLVRTVIIIDGIGLLPVSPDAAEGLYRLVDAA